MNNTQMDFSDLFKGALEAHKSGKIDQAIKLYSLALKLNSSHFDSLHLLGVAFIQSNNYDEGLKYINTAITINPLSAKAYYNLGKALQELNRAVEAIKNYDQAIQINPRFYEAYYNKANILRELQNYQEAIKCYKTAISINDKYAEAYHNLGKTLGDYGEKDQALENYNKALELNTRYVDAYYNRGNLLIEFGKFNEAIENFDAAINLKDDYAECYLSRGNAWSALESHEMAIEDYRKAIEINNKDFEPYFRIGNAYYKTNKLELSLSAYRSCIGLSARHISALFNMGVVLFDLKKYEESSTAFKAVVDIDPDYEDALWMCSISSRQANKLDLSIDSALQQYKKNIEIYNNDSNLIEICRALLSTEIIPAIYETTEQFEITHRKVIENLNIAESRLQNCTRIDREMVKSLTRSMFQMTGFYMSYHQRNDLQLMTKLSNCLSMIFDPHLGEEIYTKKGTDSRIKVGIISENLNDHNGAKWAYEWFNQLSGDYEIFCYHLGKKTDEITEQFSRLGRFTKLSFNSQTYIETIAAIRGDNLDIVMFPDIGMTPSSRILSIYRFAPVQFTGWGHPITTGSKNIDYFLSNNLMEADNGDSNYTEKLIRMPNIGLYLNRGNDYHRDTMKSLLPNGKICFGCMQSLFKYLPEYDDIFPRIALEVPSALFVFVDGSPSFMTAIMKKRLAEAFTRYGINSDNHVFFSSRLTQDDFRRLLSSMDVILDSIGWNGGNTSIAATEFGLPIVSLPSNLMRGRHTLGILSMIGMRDLVSDSIENYISQAVKYACNKDLRVMTSKLMSERNGQLYLDKAFVDGFDAFLKSSIAH